MNAMEDGKTRICESGASTIFRLFLRWSWWSFPNIQDHLRKKPCNWSWSMLPGLLQCLLSMSKRCRPLSLPSSELVNV